MNEIAPLGLTVGTATKPTQPSRAVQPGSNPGNASALGAQPAFTYPTAPNTHPASEVALGFEAAVLTPLVSQILPDENSSVWGGGAGKLWRGLFSEEIASLIARSGGVGIAPMVDHAISGKTGRK